NTTFLKEMPDGATSSPLVAKAQLAKNRNPLEAMQIAEQILESDPQNSAGQRILAEAAMAAGLPKTAAFAYAVLLKGSTKDFDLGMAYGEALAQSGQIAKAESAYQDLQRAFPLKGEIAMALKDLSAKKTLKEGGYDALASGTGSYRDILKNKDESVKLEQENRSVKSDDVAEGLIS